jgi:hypothetical protein
MYLNWSTHSDMYLTCTLKDQLSLRCTWFVSYSTLEVKQRSYSQVGHIPPKMSDSLQRNIRQIWESTLSKSDYLVGHRGRTWEISSPLFLFLAWQPFWLEFGITGHNFGRGPSKDHSTKVWFKFAQWFQRSWIKCQKLTDRWRTHRGDNSSPDSLGQVS